MVRQPPHADIYLHLSLSLSLSLSLTLTQSLSLLVSYLYTLSTESLTLSFSHIGRYTFLSLSFSLIHLSLYHSLFLSISHYISHSHTYTQSIAAVTHTLSPLHRYRYVAISTPFLHVWPKLYKAYSISLSFTLWFQNLRSFYHLSLSLGQIFLLWLYTNLSLSSLDTNAGKYFISQRLKFGWGLNLASRWDLEINKRKKIVHKRRVKLSLLLSFFLFFLFCWERLLRAEIGWCQNWLFKNGICNEFLLQLEIESRLIQSPKG